MAYKHDGISIAEVGASKMAATPSSSIIELDMSSSTGTEVEETAPSTPKRSLQASKPSTPYGVNDSPSSASTPNVTDFASSLNENQEKKFAKSWVFSTPATTPKKLVKTPDSKHSSSPSLTTTPQKDGVGSLYRTPSKQKESSDSLNFGITPLNKTPSKTIDALKWPGPSPYKSSRPKYLPKNIKLFKKKQLERQANLENLEIVDERLLQTTRTLSEETPKFSVWTDNNSVSDPMGTVLPHTDVFSPQSYFVMFDERSLDVNDFVSSESRFASKSAADIVESLRNGALLIIYPMEFRFCCYLLTVTTSRSVYDSILPLIKRCFSKDIYFGWTDLKAILVNFGLTLGTREYSTTSNFLKPPPQKWNLEFLFLLINNSFTFYKLSCNKRLLCFLIDSLFESILQDLHNTVVLLVRQVAKHLLKKGVTVEDMIYLINRSYLSSIHNRFIFQYLASDPELVWLARDLGIRTICDIATISSYSSGDMTPPQIISLLNKKFDVIVKLNLTHIHQLLLICEKLFLLSGFDPHDVEKLASFAKRVSTSYTHFSLNLNVTVGRLEALASCSSL